VACHFAVSHLCLDTCMRSLQCAAHQTSTCTAAAAISTMLPQHSTCECWYYCCCYCCNYSVTLTVHHSYTLLLHTKLHTLLLTHSAVAGVAPALPSQGTWVGRFRAGAAPAFNAAVPPLIWAISSKGGKFPVDDNTPGFVIIPARRLQSTFTVEAFN
jgi:hypothetical protein